MSAWTDAGFPDRLHLANPVRVINAIVAAYNERYTLSRGFSHLSAAVEPVAILDPKAAAYAPNLYETYHAVDMRIKQLIPAFTRHNQPINTWSEGAYINEYGGSWRQTGGPQKWTKSTLYTALGLGTAKADGAAEMDHFECHFSVEWALKMYKILNSLRLLKSSHCVLPQKTEHTQESSYYDFPGSMSEAYSLALAAEEETITEYRTSLGARVVSYMYTIEGYPTRYHCELMRVSMAAGAIGFFTTENKTDVKKRVSLYIYPELAMEFSNGSTWTSPPTYIDIFDPSPLSLIHI